MRLIINNYGNVQVNFYLKASVDDPMPYLRVLRRIQRLRGETIRQGAAKRANFTLRRWPSRARRDERRLCQRRRLLSFSDVVHAETLEERAEAPLCKNRPSRTIIAIGECECSYSLKRNRSGARSREKAITRRCENSPRVARAVNSEPIDLLRCERRTFHLSLRAADDDDAALCASK